MGRFQNSLCSVALGAILALAGSAAADPLDDLIGAEQARAMGLDKLAPAERAALARWIEQQRAGGAPVAAAASAPAPRASAVAPAAVVGSAAASAATPARSAIEPLPTPKPAIAVGSAEAFGLEQSEIEGPATKIEARIVGAFTGWDGKTVFKLDNGQVWRQSTSGVYHYKLQDPDVVIERNLWGYKLRILETKRSIAVRRIK